MPWEARVAKTLSPSVVSRFNHKCSDGFEAVVCVRVARQTSGMIGAILTGLYCYVTPVQVPDVDLNVLVDL
jgi:hypothetical protein